MAMSTSLARQSLLNLLAEPLLRNVKFTHAGISVGPDLFRDVEQAIRAGDIAVAVDPSISNDAQYDPHDSTIYLKYSVLGAAEQKALAVHELVHAGTDLRKTGCVIEVVAEAVAYIAQCYYFRLAASNPDWSGLSAADSRLFGYASDIVESLFHGESVPREMWWSLYGAILGHPAYSLRTLIRCVP